VLVCVGPRTQFRVLTAVLVFVCSTGLAGCHPADPADAIHVSWTLEPSPPVMGMPIVARLTLRDAEQKPIAGAHLRLEGLMSHPGMAPVTAVVTERGNGDYDASLQFTMAGDWILLVTGELPGGMPIKRQIEINGVRPAS
jgi:YtkA-like protein